MTYTEKDILSIQAVAEEISDRLDYIKSALGVKQLQFGCMVMDEGINKAVVSEVKKEIDALIAERNALKVCYDFYYEAGYYE